MKNSMIEWTLQSFSVQRESLVSLTLTVIAYARRTFSPPISGGRIVVSVVVIIVIIVIAIEHVLAIITAIIGLGVERVLDTLGERKAVLVEMTVNGAERGAGVVVELVAIFARCRVAACRQRTAVAAVEAAVESHGAIVEKLLIAVGFAVDHVGDDCTSDGLVVVREVDRQGHVDVVPELLLVETAIDRASESTSVDEALLRVGSTRVAVCVSEYKGRCAHSVVREHRHCAIGAAGIVSVGFVG